MSGDEKISPRAQAEAVRLIKIKTARAARNTIAKTVEADKSQLAALVAKRPSLARDKAEIRKHLNAEEELKIILEIDEASLARAQTALDDAQAEADRAAQADALEQATSRCDSFVARFDAEFPKAAQTIAELFRLAIDIEAEVASLNSKSAPGAPVVRPPLMLGEGDSALATVRIELSDSNGRVMWRGNPFSDSSLQSPVA